MAQGQQQAAPAPYAVFFLPALLEGGVEPDTLFLPLTLTYLLSMHVRFCLPVCARSLPVVERVFDHLLNGHSLESKGVVYSTVHDSQDLAAMLQEPLLVITDDRGAQRPELAALPHALVCRSENNTYQVQLRNLEKLRDEGLRGKLVGCAQLINLQSGGFVTGGHFSLSW